MNVDFVLFYEIEVRELESLVVLKKYLEKKGYSVVISDSYGPEYLKTILKYQPMVVVVPWLRNTDNIIRFCSFKNKINKIVNLQWEQIYSNRTLKNGIGEIKGIAKNAYHICWGEVTKSRLNYLEDSKLLLSGAIQLDFCRNEFSEYYLNKNELSEKYNLDIKKKWCIFISSFSYATLSKKRLDEIKNTYCDMNDFVLISQKSREMIISWITDLLRSNKQIEFIYRPHPLETIDEYLKKISLKYKNFHVIDNLTVKQWIKVCDIINNWFSTSIAEIYYMNKACNILRPLKIPEDLEVEIMNEARFITKKEEFIKNIDEEDNSMFPIDHKVIENYYKNSGKIPVYQVLGDFIIELLNKNNGDDFEIKKRDIMSYRIRNVSSSFYSLACLVVKTFKIKISKYIKNQKLKRIFKNMEQYIGIEKRISAIEKKIKNI